jgi:hypothetical protein
MSARQQPNRKVGGGGGSVDSGCAASPSASAIANPSAPHPGDDVVHLSGDLKELSQLLFVKAVAQVVYVYRGRPPRFGGTCHLRGGGLSLVGQKACHFSGLGSTASGGAEEVGLPSRGLCSPSKRWRHAGRPTPGRLGPQHHT